MVSGSSDRSVEILLVEDNPADARLARDTIEQSAHQANITHAEDGEIALSVLKKEGEHSGAPTPDLILLDLRMPQQGRYAGPRGIEPGREPRLNSRYAIDRHSGRSQPARFILHPSKPLCPKAIAVGTVGEGAGPVGLPTPHPNPPPVACAPDLRPLQ